MGEANASGRAASGMRTRVGRVLVIDDEPHVGDALALVLSDVHAVVVTRSAACAIARLEQGERFDVILCDVMMPAMSGIKLYAHVSERYPDQAARIVFMTGCSLLPDVRAFLEQVPNAWVEKPFEVAALRALVERRVHGAAPREDLRRRAST
jgi:CheY-like chemotaxis protein